MLGLVANYGSDSDESSSGAPVEAPVKQPEKKSGLFATLPTPKDTGNTSKSSALFKSMPPPKSGSDKKVVNVVLNMQLPEAKESKDGEPMPKEEEGQVERKSGGLFGSSLPPPKNTSSKLGLPEPKNTGSKLGLPDPKNKDGIGEGGAGMSGDGEKKSAAKFSKHAQPFQRPQKRQKTTEETPTESAVDGGENEAGEGTSSPVPEDAAVVGAGGEGPASQEQEAAPAEEWTPEQWQAYYQQFYDQGYAWDSVTQTWYFAGLPEHNEPQHQLNLPAKKEGEDAFPVPKGAHIVDVDGGQLKREAYETHRAILAEDAANAHKRTPGIQVSSAALGRTAARKNQITWLASDLAKRLPEIEERRAQGMAHRTEAKSKYGW